MICYPNFISDNNRHHEWSPKLYIVRFSVSRSLRRPLPAYLRKKRIEYIEYIEYIIHDKTRSMGI